MAHGTAPHRNGKLSLPTVCIAVFQAYRSLINTRPICHRAVETGGILLCRSNKALTIRKRHA